MVAGDVVNGINPIANNVLNFQPAASVEVMISSCGGVGSWITMTEGVTTSLLNPTSNALNGTNVNVKVFINNTNYLQIGATAAQYGNYSGIQIK